MPSFQPGDYAKAEFRDEATGGREWTWVQVDSCDDETEERADRSCAGEGRQLLR